MSRATWRMLAVVALAASALAAFSQVKPSDVVLDEQVSLPSVKLTQTPPVIATPVTTLPIATDHVSVSIQDQSSDSDADPFAPRAWQTESVPAVSKEAPVVAPVIVTPMETSPVLTAPVLPFAFMGRMTDGAVAMVYLSRGEESWTVKGGETLDGNYKVVSVNPQQIVFEHVPTGTQQTLSIPEPDK